MSAAFLVFSVVGWGFIFLLYLWIALKREHLRITAVDRGLCGELLSLPGVGEVICTLSAGHGGHHHVDRGRHFSWWVGGSYSAGAIRPAAIPPKRQHGGGPS